MKKQQFPFFWWTLGEEDAKKDSTYLKFLKTHIIDIHLNPLLIVAHLQQFAQQDPNNVDIYSKAIKAMNLARVKWGLPTFL